MTTSESLQQYTLQTYGRLPLIPVRGEGVFLWDEQGKRCFDFCTGIAVCSLGQCPPALVGAIQQQAATLLHVSNLYQIPQQAELARTIVEDHVKIPGKVFFSNSGAEANDGLIKTARKFGHKHPQADGSPRFEILTFTQSFHGRTLGGIAATGQDKVKAGFDPLLPGFRHFPLNDLAAIEAAILPETVAILLEPIQGEGGVHSATPEFLRGVAALCKQHDLLLFFDEVQAGFGRCGEPMAWRAIASEIEPDGISWAKGMGGGFPIGAFWTNDRTIGDVALSSLMNPGTHGSTYGGNPLACAASKAVLDEIRDKDLPANARKQERRIKETIASWNLPIVTEVRGKGLLLGIGLDTARITPPEGKLPSQVVVLKALEQGLLIPAAGPATVRLLPPLNVTDEEIDQALAILRDVLASF